MAVRDVSISDNIIISGRTLKFEATNRIEYDFDELNDRFLEGADAPVGFINEVNPRTLAGSLRDGFKPKLLTEEDVTIEVFAPESTNKIFEKQFAVKYYAQTRENPLPEGAFVTGEGEFELGVPERETQTSDDIFFPIDDDPGGGDVIISPGNGGGNGGGSGDCTGSNVSITLIDSFGDGWQGATFTITDESDSVVFSGALTGSQTSQSFDPIFMNNETHTLTVTPDDWPNEVRWEVLDENGGVLSSCLDGGCVADTTDSPANDYIETFNPCEPIVPSEPPSDITATCIGPNTVQLSWTAPTGSFETYNVYVNGSKLNHQNITGSATQYNVAPISSSTEHDFNISTDDELDQESKLSPTQSFTTIAAEDPYSIDMGVNDYIEFESGVGGLITETMVSQSKIAFEVHFKTTNTTDRIMLYQAGYGANSDEGIQIRLNTESTFAFALNNIICEIRHKGGNYRLLYNNEGDVNFTDGNWHTVAISADFTEPNASQNDNYIMLVDDVRVNNPSSPGVGANAGVLTNGTMTQFDNAMQADNIRLGISVSNTLGFNGSVFNPMWWRETRLAGELTQDRLWYCEDNLTDYKLTEQSGTDIFDNDSSVSGSLVGATWNSNRPFNPI